VLEVVGVDIDTALLGAWRRRALEAGGRLGWPQAQAISRRHAGGASLALAAPCDQLFVATEVNEWALCAALIEREPERSSSLEAALAAAAADAAADGSGPAAEFPPRIEEAAALARFAVLARREANPALRELLEAAASRGLPHLLDDSELTLGAGSGGQSFPMDNLPAVAQVRWAELERIPTALVTGSNGKTTTVRLLAACARAAGWPAGYNCTDGVFLGDDVLATGDYSGPAGARLVLRERRAHAAILETARGGILRRGLAVSQADVAIVTNISSDHFGEYGIDDLAGLADVKLTVAAAVGPSGLLVLNADDPHLSARALGLAQRFGRSPPLGWFAQDADSQALRAHRARGGSTCGVRGGRLCLEHLGELNDLGPVAAMPLTIDGMAAYNVANLAGAALAAAALGIPGSTIAAVFARFGESVNDNPGRMMRFARHGVNVLVDYAHNPDGLRGFLGVASRLRTGTGRLGLVLGHAGNRKNADMEALAQTAALFRPELVVVKENETQLRGRAPGEVPRIIRAELLRMGFDESALPLRNSEFDAVKCALAWARPGDVLALPVHSQSARAAVLALLHGE
jgi:UDP-N-acetylmuramyl tripeptide synthase